MRDTCHGDVLRTFQIFNLGNSAVMFNFTLTKMKKMKTCRICLEKHLVLKYCMSSLAISWMNKKGTLWKGARCVLIAWARRVLVVSNSLL